MNRPCPLWQDEGKCSSKECGIEHCDDEVPAALRNPSVRQTSVRFMPNAVTDSKTDQEIAITNSTSNLHPPAALHLSTSCSSPKLPSNTLSTCTSFKQAEDGRQRCETGNQFDPIDTSLSEVDKAQLADMEDFEDSNDRFCDVEGLSKDT